MLVSFLIAMAGKGGTGKTTTAGMLLRYLVERGKTPVLAVDADANSNFNEVLGLQVDMTVGQAREEMKKGGGLVDITKDQLIEMRINQCLVETEGFDLISMGQPEGPGCYCAARSLRRRAAWIPRQEGSETSTRRSTLLVVRRLMCSIPASLSIKI